MHTVRLKNGFQPCHLHKHSSALPDKSPQYLPCSEICPECVGMVSEQAQGDGNTVGQTYAWTTQTWLEFAQQKRKQEAVKWLKRKSLRRFRA